MMRNRLYTEEQIHQVVDEVLRRLGSTAALQEPEYLDNSIPQQSSPGTKMTLSVREAAELIRENQIPSIHAGKKIMIARQALMDWLSEGDTHGKKAC